MSDAPKPYADPFLCACGGTEAGKPFVAIELWMPTKAKPAVLGFQGKDGKPKPIACCATCRGEPILILRDLLPQIRRFSRYPWKSAYLRYQNNSVSERIPRALLMAKAPGGEPG